MTDSTEDLANVLTRLQKSFAINLANPNMSQRQALKAAGSKIKTDDAMDAAASRMLADVRVRAFYDSLVKQAETSAVMTREEALERLSNVAKVTIKDVCDFRNVELEPDRDGNKVFQTVWTMKNSEDIPHEIAAAIKSVTITQHGPKLELYDSAQSIKQLCDMQGWNAPKKSEITGKDGGPLQVHEMSDTELKEIINRSKK